LRALFNLIDFVFACFLGSAASHWDRVPLSQPISPDGEFSSFAFNGLGGVKKNENHTVVADSPVPYPGRDSVA
jgi:hypothetical protein